MTAPDAEAVPTPLPTPPAPPTVTRVEPLAPPPKTETEGPREVAPVEFDFVAYGDAKDYRPIQIPSAEPDVMPSDPIASSAAESVASLPQTVEQLEEATPGPSGDLAPSAPVVKDSTPPRAPVPSKPAS